MSRPALGFLFQSVPPRGFHLPPYLCLCPQPNCCFPDNLRPTRAAAAFLRANGAARISQQLLLAAPENISSDQVIGVGVGGGGGSATAYATSFNLGLKSTMPTSAMFYFLIHLGSELFGRSATSSSSYLSPPPPRAAPMDTDSIQGRQWGAPAPCREESTVRLALASCPNPPALPSLWSPGTQFHPQEEGAPPFS